MIQTVEGTPWWVWALFALLIYLGIKAKKGGKVPLRRVLILPIVFLVWAFSSTLEGGLLLWLLCLGAGILIGFFLMQRTQLKFDKKKKTIVMPGSWFPLILSMVIFGAKYVLGVMQGMGPHMMGSRLSISLHLLAIFCSGIFAGRGLNCVIRYVRYFEHV